MVIYVFSTFLRGYSVHFQIKSSLLLEIIYILLVLCNEISIIRNPAFHQ